MSRRMRHIHYFLRTFFNPAGTLNRSLSGAHRSISSIIVVRDRVYTSLESTGSQWLRYSTLSKRKPKRQSSFDILDFVRCSLHEPKGPSHSWFNTLYDCKKLLEKDGIVLVLACEYVEGSPKASLEVIKMFEGAKILQKRHPFLKVVGLQYSKSLSMNDVPTQLLQRVIKEYITFPLLLSNMDMFENAPCYVVSRGLEKPIFFPRSDDDFKLLDKAIHDLNAQSGKGSKALDFQSYWVNPADVLKEPEVFSASRNLMLSFPGCISVDECGNRFFLSDVNHHRIIIFDSNGMILDAIGSAPGFEDGEFENAKLMRPAASLYEASEDCLYFVDSENHAIRRAHMESRNVTTVFPTNESNNNKGLWEWILFKIRKKRNTKLTSDENSRESFLFPWHLLRSSSNDLLVLSQSFQTLWIIDLESGSIKEVVQESSKILETCEHMILEKCHPLKKIPSAWLPQQSNVSGPLEAIPHADLMSSVATFGNHVVFCDTVRQTVAKFSCSGSASNFQLSNFGILGLPYWLSLSLERAYAVDDVLSGTEPDHVESFCLLPGEVVIGLNVDIPPSTELIEQPQEGCIWRQARGTAVEVSGLEDKSASSEKVGVAQQFYDELDELSFSPVVEEEATAAITEAERKPLDKEIPEATVRIGCTVNTSPGTSEVIIYAVLYLRLKKGVESQGTKAAKIAHILEPTNKSRRNILTNLLSNISNRNLEELVLMRPLHVKLKFDTLGHPKAANTKGVVLTNSSFEVNVTLQ